MKLELSKEDIEIISNCILGEMERKGNQCFITEKYGIAIKKMLKTLERLNSYLCDQLRKRGK
jgi:hypothetical protein